LATALKGKSGRPQKAVPTPEKVLPTAFLFYLELFPELFAGFGG